MLRVEEAQSRILRDIVPLPAERVPLAEALGRVLAVPAVATCAQPPADNSAMDGWAVRWADLDPLASRAEPVVLRVVMTLAAGGWPERDVLPGEAARVFTGAPIPGGADSVVIQEHATALGDGTVRIDRAPRARGHHVRPAGEELRPGETYLDAGRVLLPADLALLASQGCAEVACSRRPVVAILSTGDEVHAPGEPLPRGHIWAGNAYALGGLVRQAGAVPRDLGIARDDPAALRAAFERARGADVVLSIGGVSVGDFDFVRQVLGEMGSVEAFWRVAMRPGKPNACGTLHGVPYFGLPGNPVSCLVSFMQYVWPALRKMAGAADLFLPTADAILDEPVRSKPGYLLLARGVLGERPGGGLPRVRLTGPQGSGMVRSLCLADCLVVLPEDSGDLPAGARVRVQILPGARTCQPEPGLRLAP